MKLLLIEDEVALSDALCYSLKKENISVVAKYDGESGLNEALTENYDVVVLDLMLPKLDGMEVLKRIREEKMTFPVLILTAKSSVHNKVAGLDSGADYYLTKPCDFSEFMACIRAITRRPDTFVDQTPNYGDLFLEQRKCEACCKTTGQSIKLTVKESEILEILLNNKGQIVLKERIRERVWGYENDSEYNNVEVYISFLRKKLSFIGSNVHINSTRGLGYSQQ